MMASNTLSRMKRGTLGMVAGFILLDTSVLSEARKEIPDQDVLGFLLQLPPGVLAVPEAAIFELERGALKKAKTDPVLGLAYSQWLDELLRTDIWLPPVNTDVRRLMARMASTPDLQRFWISKGEPPSMKFGCDPEIAATAIVYEMPIATCDVRDFLAIGKHFPIPGVYSPLDGRWHVPPLPGWELGEDGTFEPPEWRRMIRPIA
jgi:toxin FitB